MVAPPRSVGPGRPYRRCGFLYDCRGQRHRLGLR